MPSFSQPYRLTYRCVRPVYGFADVATLGQLIRGKEFNFVDFYGARALRVRELEFACVPTVIALNRSPTHRISRGGRAIGKILAHDNDFACHSSRSEMKECRRALGEDGGNARRRAICLTRRAVSFLA